jgi:hypothetical protein
MATEMTDDYGIEKTGQYYHLLRGVPESQHKGEYAMIVF